MTARITAATKGWKMADLLAACEGAGRAGRADQRLAEVFADPQVVARGMQIAPERRAGRAQPDDVLGRRAGRLDRPAPPLASGWVDQGFAEHQALVEQDDPVMRGVEVAAHGGRTAAARAAVEHHDRNAVRVAALLDIDAVAVAHVHHALIEGVDRRVKEFRCALLA
jgi:hypothetical protein